jgi:hypothetical protein
MIMNTEPKVGDLIASSSSSLAVLRTQVAKDPRWKTSGWRVETLHTGLGDGSGMTKFIPDYILTSWRTVAEGVWTDIPGGLQDCWTYSPAGNVWSRQLRRYSNEPVA